MSNTRLYWLHCLSPTHAGIGRGLGYIDLPIDRDTVTNWPIIRASGFKGVWADYFKASETNRKTDPLLRAAFGLTGAEDESNSGALIPSDAKLVCLPVRSFRGTFAWATSPLCLQLLHRTLTLAGVPELPAPPEKPLDEQSAHVPSGSALVEETRTSAGGATKITQKIYLEDLDFNAMDCSVAAAWAERIGSWVFGTNNHWYGEFRKRFVVVPNLPFDFLCETGTEVHTRVRIDDETKTVAQGALWTEESLPAETILMGVLQCDRVFGKNGADVTPAGLLDKFAKEPLTLQIGGKATVGRGQVRCIFVEV
ncbi:MAG: type III-B CRISPR module RAMP protein Cmr4 [Gemmataceae bacterium]|nr:type III-B CRISPR module RAMP protein Cmr4 [Gemmataceae bacterium]MDW8266396.1 type III-B CRISPR module RAMP protein Cmr4 [Gemmataceae bacterium]